MLRRRLDDRKRTAQYPTCSLRFTLKQARFRATLGNEIAFAPGVADEVTGTLTLNAAICRVEWWIGRLVEEKRATR